MCVAVTHTDLCKAVIMQWEDARSKDHIPIHVLHSSYLPFVASGAKA